MKRFIDRLPILRGVFAYHKSIYKRNGMQKGAQQSKFASSLLCLTMVIAPEIFRCLFHVDNYTTGQYLRNGFRVTASVNETVDGFNWSSSSTKVDMSLVSRKVI